MFKGIFLNGTFLIPCLIPFLLPIMAVGFVVMILLSSMFFGGLIIFIIGIVLRISLKKKQLNVNLYNEEQKNDTTEKVENNESFEVVETSPKSSILNDTEFSNELKAINILSVVTKILIVLGISFMLPVMIIFVNSIITRYKSQLSYKYNLPKNNSEYEEYLQNEYDDANDYYRPIEEKGNRVVVDKDNYKEKGFIKDDDIYIYYRHLDLKENQKLDYNGGNPVFYVVYEEDFDIEKSNYSDVYSIKTAKNMKYKFYLLDHDEDIYISVNKNEFEEEYNNDKNLLYESIKNEYIENEIPMRTTLRFYDDFEVNDYNVYLDVSREDIEKLSKNYTDEKLVTFPKGSVERKYYISIFSIDKIYRKIYPVVQCYDNKYYGFKDEKENGEVELYKIPSTLQNRIKKQIEKYKERIKDVPKFDDEML